MYHYSVRPGASLYNSTLVGPKVKDDVPEGLVHTALLAHVDEIKDGFVSGWACIPGQSLALAIQARPRTNPTVHASMMCECIYQAALECRSLFL